MRFDPIQWKRSFLFVLIAIAGCGSSVGPGYDPPLFTIHGIIGNKSVNAPTPFHISLVWLTVQITSTDVTPGFIATDLTISSPEPYPTDFQLATNYIPGPFVRENNTVDDGVSSGTVIAWIDGNNNHQLDPVPANGTTSPDIILGQSSTEVIFKKDMTPLGGEQGALLTPGFNLIDFPDAPYPSGCDGFNACIHRPVPKPTKLTPDTPIQLDLVGSSFGTNQILCELPAALQPRWPGTPPEVHGDCSSPHSPPGGSAHVVCLPGTNRFFQAFVCDHDEPVCWGTRCPTSYYGCPSSQPLPADWPCKT